MYTSIIIAHDRHNVTNSLYESQQQNLRDDIFIDDMATFSKDANKGTCYNLGKKKPHVI